MTSRDPYDNAWIKLAHASSAWFGGRGGDSGRVRSRRGRAIANECTGANWDVAMSLSFGLSAQVFLGEYRALNEAIPKLLADAERRGDRYVTTVFRSGYLVFLPLAEDCPEEAFKAAQATIREVPKDRFTAFHFHHFNAATNALLYQGEAWQAWSLIEQRWPLIEDGGFLHLACIGSLLRDLRARGALAAANEEPSKRFPQWTKDSAPPRRAKGGQRHCFEITSPRRRHGRRYSGRRCRASWRSIRREGCTGEGGLRASTLPK